MTFMIDQAIYSEDRKVKLDGSQLRKMVKDFRNRSYYSREFQIIREWHQMDRLRRSELWTY